MLAENGYERVFVAEWPVQGIETGPEAKMPAPPWTSDRATSARASPGRSNPARRGPVTETPSRAKPRRDRDHAETEIDPHRFCIRKNRIRKNRPSPKAAGRRGGFVFPEVRSRACRRSVRNLEEKGKDGAQGRNRTTDTAIFSRVLYQLSYLGQQLGDAQRRGSAFLSAAPGRVKTPTNEIETAHSNARSSLCRGGFSPRAAADST